MPPEPSTARGGRCSSTPRTTARGPRTAATPSRPGDVVVVLAALDARAEAAARARRDVRAHGRRDAGRRRAVASPAPPGGATAAAAARGRRHAARALEPAAAPAGPPRRPTRGPRVRRPRRSPAASRAPPTGVQVRPGSGSTPSRAVATTSRRSASRTCTCRRSWRPAPGRSTGTTSSTTPGSTTTRAAGPRSTGWCEALHGRGLHAVADVVPNHMAVPTPVRLNAAAVVVLRDGPGVAVRPWFDVDWSVPDRAVLMPVLGDRIGTVLADGAADRRSGGPRPATSPCCGTSSTSSRSAPAPRTCRSRSSSTGSGTAWPGGGWPTTSSTTAGSSTSTRSPRCASRTRRCSRPRTRCCSTWSRAGALAGPADRPPRRPGRSPRLPAPARTRRPAAPGSSWRRSSRATSSCPHDWPCAGTTGYDALLRVGGLFADPAAAAPLGDAAHRAHRRATDFAAVVEQAKREVVEHGLYAEVNRLVDLLVAICHETSRCATTPGGSWSSASSSCSSAFDRYRAYVVPGRAGTAGVGRGRRARRGTRPAAPAGGRLGRARPRPRPRPRPAGRPAATRRAADAARARRVRRPVPADLRAR